MAKFFSLLFALCLFSYSAFNQNVEKSISFFVGFQGIFCDSFPDKSNQDFLNYIDRDGLSGNYAYVGFSGRIDIDQKYRASLSFGMYSDFSPTNINLTTSYYPFKHLGFGASFFGYPQYISYYFSYFQNNSPGMYPDLDTNSEQDRIYNYGFAVGPEYSLRTKRMDVSLRIHIGFRREQTFEAMLYQKRINSNYLVRHRFESNNEFVPYIYPELEALILVLKTETKKFGIKFHLAGEYTKRRMNYTQESSEWIENQTTRAKVVSNWHQYSKVDLDLGIIYFW
ncbi:MAG: hypothetical protein F9K37_04985 [Bacteroidales bacterium]|nr:MAG: hypothetical protein F9K37_04985 [Bacteroidales bacterium]